jgi:opacity protein-like surface antigen
MRKINLCLIFTLFFTISKAQNLSYGALIGGNFYQSNNDSSSNQFLSDANPFAINLGGYLEYNFNENIGVKTDLTFNKKELSYENSTNFKLNFIDISPNLKYDFGNEYRKGFYMLIGPRFSFLTKAEVDGTDASDIFNKTNIGLQLGLGQRIFNYIDIQGKFDYGITPFFENDNNKSKFFGAYISLNVDLEKIINK